MRNLHNVSGGVARNDLHTWRICYTFLFICILTIQPMIVARPKASTLFSLGAFVLACLAIGGTTLYYVVVEGDRAWYQLILIAVLIPLGIGLLLRLALGYKIVRIGKEVIEIYYPSRWKTLRYKLKEVVNWTETQIKTAGGQYKEMEVHFTDNKKLTLSMQEHTSYPEVLRYMKKKCQRKYKS